MWFKINTYLKIHRVKVLLPTTFLYLFISENPPHLCSFPAFTS